MFIRLYAWPHRLPMSWAIAWASSARASACWSFPARRATAAELARFSLGIELRGGRREQGGERQIGAQNGRPVARILGERAPGLVVGNGVVVAPRELECPAATREQTELLL